MTVTLVLAKGTSMVTESIFENRFKYVDEITAAAVVFPDLKNADLQKVYGVLGDVKLLKKMLYTNEYNALVEAVQDLSGMDDDFDDLKNDAKNE